MGCAASKDAVPAGSKWDKPNPQAEFDCTMGKFKVELYMDRTPITASNFIDLCQSGFYEGIHFHRVIPNFMPVPPEYSLFGKGKPSSQSCSEWPNAMRLQNPPTCTHLRIEHSFRKLG